MDKNKQKFSTSLLIKKMLIKPTMRYFYTPTVANIKKTSNTKNWGFPG